MFNFDEIEKMLLDVAKTRMPFGKYGPKNYPPDGVSIYDLPYEYLAYFKKKGFPNGRLGKMMEFICQIKLDGGDAMFDPLRKHAGGRTVLRETMKKHYKFST